MKHKDEKPISHVIGPRGAILTLADLPSASIKRWTVLRRAEIVAAIRGGLLSLEDACERYSLTVEELISWQASDRRHGGPSCGKRATPDEEVALLLHQARLVNK